MIGFIYLIILFFTPVQQTQHCYALPEPYKHWPIYLEVTEKLNTCTHNWYTAPQFLEDERHTPSIWNANFTPGTITQIAKLASDYPGRTWLFFNEPEFEGQANTKPEIAAVHVRYWSEAVGDNGRFACCGNLFYPSLGGLKWLEDYLAADGPIPDAWHIHIYVNSVWEWNQVIGGWQRWNAEHGNLPTIISEAGSGQEVHDFVKTWGWDGFESVYWFGINEATQVGGADVLSEEWVYMPALTR